MGDHELTVLQHGRGHRHSRWLHTKVANLCQALNGSESSQKELCGLLKTLHANNVAEDLEFRTGDDPRFGSIWQRMDIVAMVAGQTDGQELVWKKLGQGSFGAAFAAKLLCQGWAHDATGWSALRAQAEGVEGPPCTAFERTCAVKLPLLFVPLAQRAAPNGRFLSTPDASSALKLESPKKVKLVRQDFLDEIRVLLALTMGPEFVDVGLLHAGSMTLSPSSLMHAAASAHALCQERPGSRYLNTLVDFSTDSIPCIVTRLRSGTLNTRRPLEQYWGRPSSSLAHPYAFGAACYQVYHGLRYMHAAGFAHMDIKPDNILFDLWEPAGVEKELHFVRCFITDFGLCWKLAEPCNDIRGTQMYLPKEVNAIRRMASWPEKERAIRDINPRAVDAFSFALTMLGLLLVEGQSHESKWPADDGAYAFNEEQPEAWNELRQTVDSGSRADKAIVLKLLDIYAAPGPNARWAQFEALGALLEAFKPERSTGGAYVYEMTGMEL